MSIRNFFAVILSLLLLFSLVACKTDAGLKENPASDFTYEFSEDDQYAWITQYIGTSKHVVIPSQIEGRTVVNLRGRDVDGFIQGVFQDTDVETVVIPKTVKVIGNRAFKDCSALSSVTIPKDSELHTISILAFENCTALKTIPLENAENLKTIGTKAFYHCESIESIQFPSSLESVGLSAFSYCTSLKSVNIPTKLNLIEDLNGPRFSHVPALEEITFDEGWQELRGYVFFAISSGANIRLPQSVTAISVTFFGNAGTTVNLHFAGDCPQLLDGTEFHGDVTIHYDPDTDGWDTTPLKDVHVLIPN